MRPFILFLSLLTLLALTACGTEDELIPPVFLTTEVNGAKVTTTPFKESSVIITGTLDDLNATLVANSTVTGEVPVAVDSGAGSWRFPLPLSVGANIVSFIASDKRGNLNQLILTVNHDPTPPTVSATSPAAGTTVTTPVTAVTVTFSEALAGEPTLANFSIFTTPISSVTYDAATQTATLALAGPLANGEQTVNFVGPITDPAGNPLAQTSFTFTVVVPAP